jgi:bifunctional DNA-binding transcriptional regulator/antitoxin component of YhaV-PrlF toxin-antitoxin module
MPTMYKCKNFNKTGKVLLPSKWRSQFGLLPGKLAELRYDHDQIIIERANLESTHNKRLISDNGSIHIPKELQLLLDITEEEEYCLYIDEEDESFILKVITEH